VVDDYQKRLAIVKKASLCFNCLGRHKVSQCGSKIRCKHCGRKHHSSLCSPRRNEPKQATRHNEPKQVICPPCRDELQQVTSNNNNSQPPAPDTAATAHATLTPISHDTDPSEQVLHIKSVTLLQTAIAPVHVGHINTLANILFDEGAQRSFITEDLAVKLQLQSFTTEHIAVASFGTNTLANRQLPVAQVQVETQLGELIPISVLVVPVIATPLHNTVRSCITCLPYLQGLKLAHPVTDEENFQISLLIGADFYWSFVGDDIICGDGPQHNTQSWVTYSLDLRRSSPLQ